MRFPRGAIAAIARLMGMKYPRVNNYTKYGIPPDHVDDFRDAVNSVVPKYERRVLKYKERYEKEVELLNNLKKL